MKEIVNTQTSFRSETITSAEGSYYVPYLNPGSYRISLEAAGFKRFVQEGVMLLTVGRRKLPLDVLDKRGYVEGCVCAIESRYIADIASKQSNAAT
jgi:hypothetical protein